MLLIGYGNPGRQDDGLGPAFAERIAARNLPGLDVMIDYQLTVDHAPAVAAAGAVVFVDALIGGKDAYSFDAVAAGAQGDLASHSLTPSAVLTLAATLYEALPPAFVLGIVGETFGEVREGLSDAALRNLAAAEAFFLSWSSPRLRPDAAKGRARRQGPLPASAGGAHA